MKTLAIPQIKRGTLTEQAMEYLLGLLHQGKLKPGDRLPSQRELASLMGLSTTVVREALRGLASMKVIHVVHGRGAYVSEVSPKDLIRPEALLLVLEREALLEAIEVRGILEVEAIALAAERHTDADLREIERVLSRIKRALDLGKDPLMQSPSFHLALAAAAHNSILAELIKPFIGLMAKGAGVISKSKCAGEAMRREWASHAELYEAVRSRDPEKARCCMRSHLEEAKFLILNGFNELRKQSDRGKGDEVFLSKGGLKPSADLFCPTS